jgi:hypothetical protein
LNAEIVTMWDAPFATSYGLLRRPVLGRRRIALADIASGKICALWG